ncbi:MAG: hypothetical protein CMO47_01625 [Verrucomicrobiales bacterium]|nr:hypothetical protein [Verrucomicrobiales bacterium]
MVAKKKIRLGLDDSASFKTDNSPPSRQRRFNGICMEPILQRQIFMATEQTDSNMAIFADFRFARRIRCA